MMTLDANLSGSFVELADRMGAFAPPMTAGGEYIQGEHGLFQGSLPAAGRNRVEVSAFMKTLGGETGDRVIAKMEASQAVADKMSLPAELLARPADEVFDEQPRGHAYDVLNNMGVMVSTDPKNPTDVEGITVEQAGQLADLSWQSAADPDVERWQAFQSALKEEPYGGTIAGERILELAKDAGYNLDATRGFAADYINAWAHSAADSRPESVALQKIAGELWDRSSKTAENYLGTELDSMNDIYNKQGPIMREYLAASYEATQEKLDTLATHGDEVQLWRGVHFMEPIADPEGDKMAKVSANPMTSWTTDRTTAVSFAERSSAFAYQYVLTATVPVGDIISTPGTGAGCLNEAEVVVLGADAHEVQLTTIREP